MLSGLNQFSIVDKLTPLYNLDTRSHGHFRPDRRFSAPWRSAQGVFKLSGISGPWVFWDVVFRVVPHPVVFGRPATSFMDVIILEFLEIKNNPVMITSDKITFKETYLHLIKQCKKMQIFSYRDTGNIVEKILKHWIISKPAFLGQGLVVWQKEK